MLKERLELMQLAASVRKTIYGPQDAVAIDYEEVAKADEAMLQKFAGMRTLFEQKSPEKFIKMGMTPDPKEVFEFAFSTPISQIFQLKGGGYAWLDYDAWVRFKSSKAVALRTPERFITVSPAEAAKKFLSLCPQDRAVLSEVANLECIQGPRNGKDSSGRQLVGGCLLLSNKKRGLYWYRTWH